MADGRRRQWIAVDVFYYSSDTASGLWDEFGMTGVLVFDAFLRACKTALVEGQITYTTPENFLSACGLPPLAFRNDDGDEWTLDELWRWLGQRHTTARRVRGGRTTVIARRWDEWQNRRSRPGNASTKEQSTDHYKDSDQDMDKDTDPPYPPFADGSSSEQEQETQKRCECVNGRYIGEDGFAHNCNHNLRVVS